MSKNLIIGKNEDGTVDEIFVTGDLHIEQMSDSNWWLGVNLPNGTYLHVNFWTPRARIRVDYNSDIEGYGEGGEFGSGVMT